ncbi:hypothetical protein CEXT_138451 [Caerostris extrusa]|uniref:Uncharacterized protein n=1 Tax=Caerostris extrusa TaxID=172846 RepID=A0AAV4VPL0_CAEEX|nr:hypothetical protein CEXT_138451 [Caerostris extrusa]
MFSVQTSTPAQQHTPLKAKDKNPFPILPVQPAALQSSPSRHASTDEHITDHHPTTTKRTPTGNRGNHKKKTGHGSEREHGGVFTAARPWLDCRISVARSPSSPLRR